MHDEAYVVTTRRGRRGMSEQQVRALVNAESDEALVLLSHIGELHNHGSFVSLKEKRVILPLIRCFLDNPDTAHSMKELGLEIWGTQDVSSGMQTKIKVAVSRARALLGKDRDYIVTGSRAEPEGGSCVTYCLAEDLDFYLISEGTGESSEG